MYLQKYRWDLLLHLVKRDFLLRYKRSALGVLWSLLVPLAQLLVLTFIFGRVVPLNIEAYPAFLFASLLPWTWFSASLWSAGGIFYTNRDLMFQPNFDPVVLVAVNTLSNLLLYMAALPILVALLIWYGRPLTWALITWPVLILIQAVFITGLSLVISTVNVYYRDVEHCVGIGLLLLFYLTPIFYRSEAISGHLAMVFILNPVAELVVNYREIFFYGRWPTWPSLLGLGLFSLGMGVVGYGVYRAQLPRVMDEL
jgi:lipopolysaccharide transport system permease protein